MDLDNCLSLKYMYNSSHSARLFGENRYFEVMQNVRVTIPYRAKTANISGLSTLHVRSKTYLGNNVASGFFDAITDLKSKYCSKLNDSLFFHEFAQDYSHIIKLCKSACSLKNISVADALYLLNRMKSINPNHYMYAGHTGWKHFFLLLIVLLRDV